MKNETFRRAGVFFKQPLESRDSYEGLAKVCFENRAILQGDHHDVNQVEI